MTPKYIIYRELGLEKLVIGWGARAYEERIRTKEEEKLVQKCWKKKEGMVKKKLYSREKEGFFNHLG